VKALHDKALVEFVPDPNHKGWNLVRPLVSSTPGPFVTHPNSDPIKQEHETRPAGVLESFETIGETYGRHPPSLGSLHKELLKDKETLTT